MTALGVPQDRVTADLTTYKGVLSKLQVRGRTGGRAGGRAIGWVAGWAGRAGRHAMAPDRGRKRVVHMGATSSCFSGPPCTPRAFHPSSTSSALPPPLCPPHPPPPLQTAKEAMRELLTGGPDLTSSSSTHPPTHPPLQTAKEIMREFLEREKRKQAERLTAKAEAATSSSQFADATA